MAVDNTLVILQDCIRKVWHEGEWWFSVVDIVGVLTDCTNPVRYWSNMKRRLATDEGFSEVYAQCIQLKMRATDGKMRTTDAANTKTLLRIIQSIPSPKAEPFKQWLAQVGTERLQGIQRRNAVTVEWGLRGAKKGREYAVLTDTLSVEAFDITTAEHRQIKGLTRRDNLQDSQTGMELAITGLADEAAATLHRHRDSQGFPALQNDCQDAGKVAGDARRQFEELSGQKVVSSLNYKQLRQERQRELQPPLFEQSEE